MGDQARPGELGTGDAAEQSMAQRLRDPVVLKDQGNSTGKMTNTSSP